MKRKNILITIVSLILLIASVTLIAKSFGYKRDSPSINSVDYITTAQISINGSAAKETPLPCIISNLEPNTPVSITANIHPKIDDGVFIQSDYSPATIYFDNKNVFVMGKSVNYPSFMKESGKEVHVVETYGDGGNCILRVDYLSPARGNDLIIYQPMVGSSKELILERAHRFGVSWIFSITQIIGGFALILISIFITLVDRKGLLFFWLGLFSMLSGAWLFGSNNFCVTVFPDTAFLYLTSFIGLFISPVALLHFIRLSVNFKNSSLVRFSELFFTVFACIALILQLFSVVSLHRIAHIFNAILPIPMVMVAILTISEYFKYKNIDALRFILPISIVTVSAFEGIVSELYPFSTVVSRLFQVCTLLFLFMVGILVSVYVKDSLNLKSKMKELVFENELLEIRVDAQTKAAMKVVQHEQTLNRQRHDLRHHLTAIRELVFPENIKLQNYLNDLIGSIPKGNERFCENQAVNAVVSHYNSMCAAQHIDSDIRICVPEDNPNVPDGVLCAIFGNLLENAVEACGRIKDGEKFICMRSSLHYGLLTVTLDNSFNGEVNIQGSRFRSSKRDNFGIGIASIEGMARTYNGNAEFVPDGTIFRSSVYLKL